MTHTILGIVLLWAAAGQSPAVAGQTPQIEGVWRGTSQCQVKNSPCNDETNVYRITAVEGKPNRFRVLGNKIVDGKEIAMGPASLWYYEPGAHALTYALGNGHFWLKIDGDTMDGGLMLADMTVYRKIHLVRARE